SLRRPEPKIDELEDAEIETTAGPPAGGAPTFDWDVIEDFNAHIPLSLWVDASANSLLPSRMQLRVAQTGWVRALALGRNEEARKFMDRIVALQPGASAVARPFLDARDTEEARFAGLFIILSFSPLDPMLPAPESPVVNLSKPKSFRN